MHTVNFVFRVTDDNTNAGAMLVNELSISEYQDNFTNSIDITSQIFESTYHVWLLAFDTSILQVGKTYFFRYTINDGENAENTIYPNNQTSVIYKSIWSFTVQ